MARVQLSASKGLDVVVHGLAEKATTSPVPSAKGSVVWQPAPGFGCSPSTPEMHSHVVSLGSACTEAVCLALPCLALRWHNSLQFHFAPVFRGRVGRSQPQAPAGKRLGAPPAPQRASARTSHARVRSPAPNGENISIKKPGQKASAGRPAYRSRPGMQGVPVHLRQMYSATLRGLASDGMRLLDAAHQPRRSWHSTILTAPRVARTTSGRM